MFLTKITKFSIEITGDPHNLIRFHKWFIHELHYFLFHIQNEMEKSFQSQFRFLALTEFSDLKMAVLKRYSNFVSCNSGLKSYLWFQI